MDATNRTNRNDIGESIAVVFGTAFLGFSLGWLFTAIPVGACWILIGGMESVDRHLPYIYLLAAAMWPAGAVVWTVRDARKK
jgi:hypothetical protein